MIQVDDFLTIGKSHKICEDYVVSGTDPIPHIIVSDGCSSSKGTDMGSRILCFLAKQYLIQRKNYLNHLDSDMMGQWIINNAELTAKQLGLDRSSLDATLIVAIVIEGRFEAHIFGDGAIISKSSFGNYSIHEVSYTPNAPYYLSYLVDPSRDEQYHSMKVKKFIKKTTTCSPDSTSFEWAYDNPFNLSFGLEGWKSIAVCSDGIESFLESNEPVEIEKAIEPFLAFKNTKGEFLKRRAGSKKGAMNELKESGVENFDDLSMGVFLKVDDATGSL